LVEELTNNSNTVYVIMTGKAEIQNKQVVGVHNTTEPMNAYFVIITEPLRVLWD